jgi:hypothetical protein
MEQLKRKGIVLLTIVGLLAFSGLASAAEDTVEDPPEDTTFNIAYDESLGVFLWGVTVDDDLPDGVDCSLANGDVDVTYGDPGPDGVIPVTYSAPDAACVISGAEVAGPEGQVNHGMFMKLFNSLYEGQGRGCLVRYLAQSGLGRGDQQITVADVDPAFVPVAADDTGTVTFFTAAADCQRGNEDQAEDSASSRRGRPAAPGKSGDAPGRNK